MSDQPYTYVEADSSLYGPDGTFLKQAYCPKAAGWNQVIVNNPEERNQGCYFCFGRITNLDTTPVDEAVQALKNDQYGCVCGTEKSIRVLIDKNKPKTKCEIADGVVKIQTVRGQLSINRAAAIGFWPEVHIVHFIKYERIREIDVLQNKENGFVFVEDGPRSEYKIEQELGFDLIISGALFYGDNPQESAAAYLIPKNLPAGTRVLIEDPIADEFYVKNGFNFNVNKLKGVWDGVKLIFRHQDQDPEPSVVLSF